MTEYCGPSGPLDANLAFVGEAPGENELLDGEPFTGSSGRLLWTLCSEVGLSRNRVYCTNVIKTRANQNPLTNMSRPDLELWRGALIAELQQLRCCNLLVLLGNTALWALTQEYGIANWRGSLIRSVIGTKCLPMFHPAAALRTPEILHTLQRDIKLAIVESLSPELRKEQGNMIIEPVLKEALDYIESAHYAGRIAFDIETRRGITTCISICFRDVHNVLNSMSIPFVALNYWKPDELSEIYKALQALLGDTSLIKIGQNVSYDIIGLAALGIEVKPPYIDTMHMHHAIDPQVSHSLAFQASMYLNRPFWKDWDIAPDAPLGKKLDSYFTYNALDSLGTYELADIYKRRFQSDMQLYDRRYASLLPHLIQMYKDGICIDTSLQQRLNNTLTAQASTLEAMVTKEFKVKPFNVRSPTQLKLVLYNEVGLPKQYNGNGKNKHLTTDDNALVEIYLQTQEPLVLAIRDCIRKYKLASFLSPISKEAQKKRMTWDGRLRCEYKLETETGRLSSSASTASGVGINLQQIPPLIRQTFVPAEGCLFLEGDASQIQARIVAWDSQDYEMMHQFELARQDPEKYDIHWHNAEITLELPRSALTKLDRSICKHVVYGSFFDMHEHKLQRTILKYTDPPLFIDLKECKRRQDIFKSKVPKFTERQERIKHEVLTTGKQVSPTGRVVTYHDIIHNRYKYCFGHRNYAETIRSAYSMVPQDVEAEIINTALVRIDTELRRRSLGRVCLQVHDSIMVEVQQSWSAVETAFDIMQTTMEMPYSLRGNEMIVPVEFKLGSHWPCGQASCTSESSGIRTIEQLDAAYRSLYA